jgi:hypothetical protein
LLKKEKITYKKHTWAAAAAAVPAAAAAAAAVPAAAAAAVPDAAAAAVPAAAAAAVAAAAVAAAAPRGVGGGCFACRYTRRDGGGGRKGSILYLNNC